jgi:shikimate dehydrogenase
MQIFERWTGIHPEEAVFQQAVAEALGESRLSGAAPG